MAPAPERGAADTVAEALLTLAAGLALFLSAMSVWLVTAGAKESTETGLYLVTFALLLPATVLATPRLAAGLRERAVLVPAAAVWSAGLLLVLLGARVAYAIDGSAGLTASPVFLAALAVWAAASAGAVRVLPRLSDVPPGRLLALPAVPAVLLLIGFPSSYSLEPGQLIPAALVAGALAAVYAGLVRRRIGGRAGAVLDVLVVLLAIAALNDLSLYQHSIDFINATADLHQDFYLGPANDVAHGRAALVDAFSQYGPGPLMFLGGWFQLADVGYGGLSLLAGLLTALLVAVAFVIARAAGASRPLAFTGAVLIAAACVFVPDLPPPSWFPSAGGLRYLPPYLVIVAVLAGGRRGRLAAAVLVGLTAIWSFETFGYAAAALGGMALFEAMAEAGGARAVLRRLVASLTPAAAMVVVAHVIFAVSTRVLAGDWPRWGWYLDYLGTYSVDELGALPIEPWSPGLLLATVYFGSLCVLAVLVRRAPELVRSERPALTAIAGVAPLGVVTFAYFAGRSHPEVAAVIAPPCILIVTLWLTLLEHRRGSLAPGLRAAAVAAPLAAAGVLAVSVWPTLEERAGHTPLAMAIPDGGDGGSLRDELRTMWDSPPIHPPVPVGAELIRTHFPGDGPARVLLENELTTQVLMEAERVNALPVSHWIQDGLVFDRAWPRMHEAVERLEPGDLILTHAVALAPRPRYPGPLLRRTAAEIRRRFRLVLVDGDPEGLFVARLAERRP